MTTVPRIFTISHALLFTFIFGGMLTVPHLVLDWFYPDGKAPPDSEDLMQTINHRAYGVSVLSMQVMLLIIAYLNESTLYKWAFFSLAPYHVTMLVLAILAEHTYLIVLHIVILLLMLASFWTIMGRMTLWRKQQFVGTATMGSHSDPPMEIKTISGKRSADLGFHS